MYYRIFEYIYLKIEFKLLRYCINYFTKFNLFNFFTLFDLAIIIVKSAFVIELLNIRIL